MNVNIKWYIWLILVLLTIIINSILNQHHIKIFMKIYKYNEHEHFENNIILMGNDDIFIYQIFNIFQF